MTEKVQEEVRETCERILDVLVKARTFGPFGAGYLLGYDIESIFGRALQAPDLDASYKLMDVSAACSELVWAWRGCHLNGNAIPGYKSACSGRN